ncbi:YtxH domain-containing protein [Agrilactobacillus yilanensis]|uniref:YtxH domain-containing protein n=1 Tax=Agrilactobacillus yilanensis TaxID=2485997 RepID=A0ABW4J8N6_9LACO|nr:YtxH domain-containing protein [Agrilactobacillus yilanensis]
MANFSKGLLLGALIGSAYGLLTTKKTGPQRIRSLTEYVGAVTDASIEFQGSLAEVKRAVADLSHELQTTAKSAAEDLNDTMNTFQFETEPRIKQINAEVEELNDSLNQMKPS